MIRSVIFAAVIPLLLSSLPAAETAVTPLHAPPNENGEKTTEGADEMDARVPGTPSAEDPAAQKYWRAITLLERKDAASQKEGVTLLQEAAAMEFTHAQTTLADCLMSGSYGLSKEPRKAFNQYRLAAERGNGFAAASVGQCYYFGVGIRKDREKAAKWLSAALAPTADFSRPDPPPEFFKDRPMQESGIAVELERDPVSESHANAHYLLGMIAAQANKAAEAQAHYVAAATAGPDGRSGLYPAAAQAALNYAFGQGVARDSKKANELLAIARKLSVRAQIRVVHNFAELKIIDDFAVGQVEEELTESGEQFQGQSQMAIGSIFEDKASKSYNPAEAAAWYELAAETGQTWAMLKLAFLHAKGISGKPEYEKAFVWFERLGSGDSPKHYLGVANLAICLQNGIGTATDARKAAALFQRFKDDEFVCYLGTKGLCPTTLLTWEDRIKLLEKWAKSKNDPHAQYFLGLRHLNGWDLVRDPKVAIRWFTKAAKAGHGGALTQLGLLHENRWYLFGELPGVAIASAAQCYKKSAEMGDADGMANYAYMLSAGKGVKPDEQAAKQLYLRCIEVNPKHARAHNNLASIYQTEITGLISALRSRPQLQRDCPPEQLLGWDENAADTLKRTIDHYEAALNLGFAYAGRNLGFIYSQAVLVPKDQRKSYRYFEKAADLGSAEAHLILGDIHAEGNGVPITYSEAAYHYRLAALDGNRAALRRLIDLYLSGKTGTVDWDRALFWLSRLIAEGDFSVLPNYIDALLETKKYELAVQLLKALERDGGEELQGYACIRLSGCYQEGLGVKRNESRSRSYRERALKNNNSFALYDLGTRQFEEGKWDLAVTTLTRASYGSPDACYSLGQIYYFGEHVERDKTRAFGWFRKAANFNHSAALYFLAATSYNRDPGAPTQEEALLFAKQAEAGGYPKAAELREKIEKRVNQTPDEQAEETAHARSS